MIRPAQIGRVNEDYQSAYPDPLKLEVGDEVLIEDRPSDWGGWLWCIDQRDKCGWVPKTHLRRNGDRGVVMRSYDATELSVKKGELLTIVVEESGWLWCRNGQDQQGWVPGENVEISD